MSKNSNIGLLTLKECPNEREALKLSYNNELLRRDEHAVQAGLTCSQQRNRVGGKAEKGAKLQFKVTLCVGMS